MKHDKCRNTDRFQCGQNLAFVGSTGKLDIAKELEDRIQKLYDEYKDASQADIDEYEQSNRVIGHFTQLVRDQAKYVGCGVVIYDTIHNGFKMQTLLLACNYSYPNMLNEAVYKSGDVCSNCKKCNNIYKGLCDE